MSYCILSVIPNLYYFYYLSYDCVIVTMICLQFCVYDLVQKRMTKRNFPKRHAILNIFPDSKQDIRKPRDLHSLLYK